MLVHVSKRQEVVDCLNCAASHRLCDRTRYRCHTCPQNSDTCRGYPRQLRWLTGVTSRGKHKNSSLSIQSTNPEWQPVTPANHRFKFKPGRAQRQRKQSSMTSNAHRVHSMGALSSQPVVRSPRSQSGQNAETEPVSGPIIELGLSSGMTLADSIDIFDDQLETLFDTCGPCFTVSSEDEATPLPHVNQASAWQEEDHDDGSVSVLSTTETLSVSNPQQSLVSAVATSGLLTFYDTEVCMIPFTHDFPANPLRRTDSLSTGSKHLLHALLAFSLQYVSRLSDTPEPSVTQQITTYKCSAADSYTATSLTASESTKRHLLEITFILFALNTFESAAGPWNARLSDAYMRIEFMGGVDVVAASPRARAQLMMFLWWDCSIALVARSNPVFPPFYYDNLLECNDDMTYDIFTISGVPKDLFQYCRELAELASEKKQISKFKHVVIDINRILELERSIQEYTVKSFEPPGGDDSDELIECWHDYYNMTNAWKYSLLLYISRVLKWDAARHVRPLEFTSLSRLVLDSVRCCRPESQMQKQLLFPIFVAGSESLDHYSRAFVNGFCESWYQKSRYALFREASALLQEIWTQRDLNPNDSGVWWASVVDSKQSEGFGFLFG